jgi:hypothetical protein
MLIRDWENPDIKLICPKCIYDIVTKLKPYKLKSNNFFMYENEFPISGVVKTVNADILITIEDVLWLHKNKKSNAKVTLEYCSNSLENHVRNGFCLVIYPSVYGCDVIHNISYDTVNKISNFIFDIYTTSFMIDETLLYKKTDLYNNMLKHPKEFPEKMKRWKEFTQRSVL